MIIHASNTTGLGASKVVKEIIQSLPFCTDTSDVRIILPEEGVLANYEPKIGEVKRYKRLLGKGASRVIELLFSDYIFPQNEKTIVLGDIPLKKIKNQIVLVHSPNLITPEVNKYSRKDLKFKISRYLFKKNIAYAKRVIVQSGIMAEEMLKSYPGLENKISIITQPPPEWITASTPRSTKVNIRSNQIIKLFYPATGYPHKNHQFLKQIDTYLKQKHRIANFEVSLTLQEDEFERYKDISFVNNLGRLSEKEMISEYKKCDALLFLSLMESYGLPLVEAMYLNLPILSVDLGYARWMCEEKAIYFEENDVQSFITAIDRLSSLKYVDYSKPIRKFPENWQDVTQKFLNLL